MPRQTVILHVENDEDDLFILRRAMTKAGVDAPIKTASNGEVAVSYLLGQGTYADRGEHPLPSVILLDWNMPLMSGAEFLQWLRAQSAWKRVPVIVLTSSTAERDMEAAYALGANGFLVKPADQEGFRAMCRAFADYWLSWNRSEFDGRLFG